jgi:hypothetical protein
MHQRTAAPGLTDSSDGVSPVAQSTAAAAIDDGQWSKNSMSVAEFTFFTVTFLVAPSRTNTPAK